MEITIHKKPCILLEAAELVYGYVNEIPAEKLTSKGKYCIPPEEVRKIQTEACAGLVRDDKELQFYFHGVPLDSRARRMSCLACSLLYTSLDVSCSGVDDMLDSLKKSWVQLKKPLRVSDISGFTLRFEEADSFLTLSEEIGKLPIPQSYQIQLVDVYSSYNWHLDRVGAILRPVAERLEPLLAPWVVRAMPLIGEREQELHEPTVWNSLARNTRLSQVYAQRIEIAFRYFSPYGGPGRLVESSETTMIHMGLVRADDVALDAVQIPESWELSAFRLLSGFDRVRMLHAMMDCPMSVQDLCLALDLNPGTVFRDLNNLYNVGLLTLDMISGRNCYTTNLPAIERITNHLIRYLKRENI